MAQAKIVNGEAKRVPLESVKPHPENPRQGDVGAIYESIKANGFYGFLVVQKSTGYILVGSHRWRAAQELGLDKVPVVFVDVDDDRARRIMLADNRTNDAATYDNAALAALLEDIQKESGSLEGTGFDGDALDDLMFDLNRSIQEQSGAAPLEQPEGEGPADVKMVQLFFSGEDHLAFIQQSERLREWYGTSTLTDTVAEAMRRECGRASEE